MAIPRIQQEDEEVLRDSLPYHWLKGLAQNEEEEARRRRHVAPPPPPPPPPAAALAIIVPARRERGSRSFFTCRCLDGSIIEMEEGQKCPPGCNPITQQEPGQEEREPFPLTPFLFTLGYFAFMIYAIAKRPFG